MAWCTQRTACWPHQPGRKPRPGPDHRRPDRRAEAMGSPKVSCVGSEAAQPARQKEAIRKPSGVLQEATGLKHGDCGRSRKDRLDPSSAHEGEPTPGKGDELQDVSGPQSPEQGRLGESQSSGPAPRHPAQAQLARQGSHVKSARPRTATPASPGLGMEMPSAHQYISEAGFKPGSARGSGPSPYGPARNKGCNTDENPGGL